MKNMALLDRGRSRHRKEQQESYRQNDLKLKPWELRESTIGIEHDLCAIGQFTGKGAELVSLNSG